MNALPMAQKCWDDGVQSGRIIAVHDNNNAHERAFDLYLPKRKRRHQHRTNYSQKKKKQGLIFLPGLMVDHHAYANCAKRLANRGIIVVVVSAEPLRLPAKFLGCDAADVRQIQKCAEATLLRDCYINGGGDDVEWSLGGHSFGAYRAMALAKELNVRKLIIWAAGKLEEFVPNYLRSDDAHEIRVLAIQADRDGICSFSSEMEYAKFKRSMPSDAVHYMVKGGNHAGFASYPTNSFDIESRISRNVQHRLVCGWTAKFLVNGA